MVPLAGIDCEGVVPPAVCEAWGASDDGGAVGCEAEDTAIGCCPAGVNDVLMLCAAGRGAGVADALWGVDWPLVYQTFQKVIMTPTSRMTTSANHA